MSKKHSRWSPQEIADMREWLAAGATLKQVGALYYGVTHQRISQLVGRLERPHPPRETGWKNPRHARAESSYHLVAELSRQGLDDQQIAKRTGLALNTVRIYRSRNGLYRQQRHPAEHIRWCLRLWVELFGYVPAASDWNPPMARKQGHGRRAIRFEQFRAMFEGPYASEVTRYLSPWADFIDAGGYPRPGHGTRSVQWRTAPLLSELSEKEIRAALAVVGPKPEI